MTKKVLLVGCGEMGLAYWKVLQALDVRPAVVGRGASSAERFKEKTGCAVVRRPLEEALAEHGSDTAIVAVSVDTLYDTTKKLLGRGVRRILVEKPAGLAAREVSDLEALARHKGADVYVAYNRRFYASTLLAKEIIAQDGGVQSAHFDFTEWSHQIVDLPLPAQVKRHWFLANSTHVVDLVFHVIGHPRELCTMTGGSLDWHPSASVYAGHGISERGVLFTYHANWAGPGRWMCEFVTSQHKLIFQPMEALKVMKKGSVAITDVPARDDSDAVYKPGLYRQVKAFFEGAEGTLCRIEEHVVNWQHYQRIGNYQ